MKRHVESLHLGKRLVCPHCDKTFRISDSINLDQHIRKHHLGLGERKYKCQGEGCNAAYAFSASLRAHINDVHLGTKWKCDVDGCDEEFTSKTACWLRYRLIHAEKNIQERVAASKRARIRKSKRRKRLRD